MTPTSVLHLFSIKKIFYEKMDLSLFYFKVTIYFIDTDVLNT